MRKHYEIKIRGQVQGVGFRYSAKELADKLGVSGSAQNLSDGTLLIRAESEPDRLEQFLSWCRQGPEKARVDNISYNEAEIKNYDRFETIT